MATPVRVPVLWLKLGSVNVLLNGAEVEGNVYEKVSEAANIGRLTTKRARTDRRRVA
jgi:hypothetical protein